MPATIQAPPPTPPQPAVRARGALHDSGEARLSAIVEAAYILEAVRR